MGTEEIEDRISDLENAYAEIEEAIKTYPKVSNGKGNIQVLEQILDGIQYFINELSWQKEQMEVELENEINKNFWLRKDV